MEHTTAMATGIPEQKPIISRANADYFLWTEEREETWMQTGKEIRQCGQCSLSPILQFVEERPGFLKVSGVKAFGKPAVNLCQ
jgi:hypothetical protein